MSKLPRSSKEIEVGPKEGCTRDTGVRLKLSRKKLVELESRQEMLNEQLEKENQQEKKSG